MDIDAIEPIRVSAEFDPTETWMEFEAGSPGQGLGLEVHDRAVAYERFRLQRLLFRVAAEVIAPFDKPWLFPDALSIVQRVVEDRVEYGTGVDRRELCNLRYMDQLRQRISDSVRPEAGSEDRLLPVLDSYDPIGSTDRIAFVTAKLCEPTVKSHISHVVADSRLEVQIAHELEGRPRSCLREERSTVPRDPVPVPRSDSAIPPRLPGKAGRWRDAPRRGQGQGG